MSFIDQAIIKNHTGMKKVQQLDMILEEPSSMIELTHNNNSDNFQLLPIFGHDQEKSWHSSSGFDFSSLGRLTGSSSNNSAQNTQEKDYIVTMKSPFIEVGLAGPSEQHINMDSLFSINFDKLNETQRKKEPMWSLLDRNDSSSDVHFISDFSKEFD